MIRRYRRERGRSHKCPACDGWGAVIGGPLGIRDCGWCDDGYVRVTRWTALRSALNLLSLDDRRTMIASRADR